MSENQVIQQAQDSAVLPKYVILVAGGTGTRMAQQIPKQFILLNGKPVLYYSLNSFLNAYPDLKIILVLPEEYVAAGQEIIDAFFSYDRIQITIGGRTRFHSVQNGLKLISEESVVMVHDAARCLITETLIRSCVDAVMEFGSGVPAIPCKDSLRVIYDNGNETLERSKVRIIQTPQAFYSKILIPAYNIDYKEKFTDEASVVEAFGLKLHLVEGDSENIKITEPVDLIIAENILKQRAGKQSES